MDFVRIAVGAAVLALGRKLYWLFVGVVGFASSFALATRFLSGRPDWMILIIALAAGLLGALLAVFLQNVAIGIAGFLAGGSIGVALANVIGWDPGRFQWVPFLIGGVVSLVLVLALFDWALIVLSSLAGAGLIVQAIDVRRLLAAVVFVALVIVGIAIQAGMMRSDRTTQADQGEF
jgi:hypothetical protein